MTSKHKQKRIEAELARLADGTLPADVHERARAGAGDSPELLAALEGQRQALDATRSLAHVPAPDSLHRAIQAEIAGAASRDVRRLGRRPERPRRSWPATRWRAATAIALAAAACAAAVLAVTAGGPAAAPTVLQASRLGLRPATLPSPPESRSERGELVSSAAGIPYPYWQGRFGWRTAGARADHLGDRTVKTVFYTDTSARRVGYSIVMGSALPLPAGAVVDHHGISFRVLSSQGVTVVTWRRAGHTCILTARGVAADTLVHLGAWA